MSRSAASAPARLLFPLALVLFEFAVYIANDMIQPGMLRVVREFGVATGWVPTAMSAYLAGGALLPWLVGPLSDHVGRRPVMLCGVAAFIAACLAVMGIHGIHAFIVLRVLQGMGLCFISAVGYATVQEAFEENAAVKTTALMSNVALLAPLIGPVAGAMLTQVWPWRGSFLLIAALAAIALAGLWLSMPETVQRGKTDFSPARMANDYRILFGNRRFVASALCIPLVAMPLMGWIALSPVILVRDAGMRLSTYGLWQLPVFAALIAGNLTLVKCADRWPLGRSVALGRWPLVAGLALCVSGSLLSSVPCYFLIAGTCCMAYGEGLAFAVLYRFALTAGRAGKGTVAAGMTMLSLASYAGGVEIMKRAYLQWQIGGLSLTLLLSGVAYLWLARRCVGAAMAERSVSGSGIRPAES
jgi:DHA1 family multidrug/chloramphenicol efflux transport protein-like MFS transporter